MKQSATEPAATDEKKPMALSSSSTEDDKLIWGNGIFGQDGQVHSYILTSPQTFRHIQLLSFCRIQPPWQANSNVWNERIFVEEMILGSRALDDVPDEKAHFERAWVYEFLCGVSGLEPAKQPPFWINGIDAILTTLEEHVFDHALASKDWISLMVVFYTFLRALQQPDDPITSPVPVPQQQQEPGRVCQAEEGEIPPGQTLDGVLSHACVTAQQYAGRQNKNTPKSKEMLKGFTKTWNVLQQHVLEAARNKKIQFKSWPTPFNSTLVADMKKKEWIGSHLLHRPLYTMMYCVEFFARPTSEFTTAPNGEQVAKRFIDIHHEPLMPDWKTVKSTMDDEELQISDAKRPGLFFQNMLLTLGPSVPGETAEVSYASMSDVPNQTKIQMMQNWVTVFQEASKKPRAFGPLNAPLESIPMDDVSTTEGADGKGTTRRPRLDVIKPRQPRSPDDGNFRGGGYRGGHNRGRGGGGGGYSRGGFRGGGGANRDRNHYNNNNGGWGRNYRNDRSPEREVSGWLCCCCLSRYFKQGPLDFFSVFFCPLCKGHRPFQPEHFFLLRRRRRRRQRRQQR